MRTILTVGLVLLLTCPAIAAAPKKKKKEQADPNPAIDRIAREVFKENDRNHNSALSRTELHTAEKDAQTRLLQLARQGVLGAGKKDVEVSPAAASQASLEKSNKVSQDEFTAYVHSMAQQVDIAARQQNQTAAAQQKKLAAAKKAAAQKRAANKRKK
jgi:hypothetical protein